MFTFNLDFVVSINYISLEMQSNKRIGILTFTFLSSHLQSLSTHATLFIVSCRQHWISLFRHSRFMAQPRLCKSTIQYWIHYE